MATARPIHRTTNYVAHVWWVWGIVALLFGGAGWADNDTRETAQQGLDIALMQKDIAAFDYTWAEFQCERVMSRYSDSILKLGTVQGGFTPEDWATMCWLREQFLAKMGGTENSASVSLSMSDAKLDDSRTYLGLAQGKFDQGFYDDCIGWCIGSVEAAGVSRTHALSCQIRVAESEQLLDLIDQLINKYVDMM